MFLTIRNKFKSGKISLPDKVAIFSYSLWIWVYITYTFNRFIGLFLKLILTYLPDRLVLSKDENKKPTIINANINNKNITNKIKLIINKFWDDEIGENGGVNVREIIKHYPLLEKSIVCIYYIFEIEDEIKEIKIQDMPKTIKCILLNISKNIYHSSDNSYNGEEMLFGELPF